MVILTQKLSNSLHIVKIKEIRTQLVGRKLVATMKKKKAEVKVANASSVHNNE